jgi:hypothetical protein
MIVKGVAKSARGSRLAFAPHIKLDPIPNIEIRTTDSHTEGLT